jgi:hypothetical protein
MRRKCILCAVAFVILCVIWLRLVLEQSNFIIPLKTHRFDNFDNVTGTEEMIVPNVIHFILFGHNSLEFVSFLSILSALKVLTVVFSFPLKLKIYHFFVVINKTGRHLMYFQIDNMNVSCFIAALVK